MRFIRALYRFAVVPALALGAGCTAGTGDATIADGEDSTALAGAAAAAVANTLGETPLGADLSQGGLIIEPAANVWDSTFAAELRRRAPATRTVTDSATLLALSTHGFEMSGDTATIVVVLRSCVTGDLSFNFSRDSLVHRLVRSDTAATGWEVVGPVMRDHAIGVCHAADSLAESQ